MKDTALSEVIWGANVLLGYLHDGLKRLRPRMIKNRTLSLTTFVPIQFSRAMNSLVPFSYSFSSSTAVSAYRASLRPAPCRAFDPFSDIYFTLIVSLVV